MIRLGALLGVCPGCLWIRRAKCLACRRSGRWSSWLEHTTSKDLADALAWQLWKVREAYYERVGERFSFDRED